MIMKQLFSIILLFSSISITVHAQELSYDIEAGMAVGKQIPRYDATSSWGIGIRAGGNVHYTLPCQVVLSTGLFFLQKRTELDGETMYPIYTNIGWDKMWTKVHRLNYLQLPLLTGYDIDCGGDVSICPQVGFFVNYGIGGKQTIYDFTTLDAPEYPFENTRDYTNNPFKVEEVSTYSRWDMGLMLALRISYRKVGIKVSYEKGFINTGGVYDSRTRTWNIGMSYML